MYPNILELEQTECKANIIRLTAMAKVNFCNSFAVYKYKMTSEKSNDQVYSVK